MATNLQRKPEQISTTKNFIAGGFGGICLVAAGHPLDTVKVRMQTMAKELSTGERIPYYNGTLDCVRKIFTYEGIKGFYKGMATPLVGITPLYSIAFFGYSLGKKLQTPIDGHHYSALQIFNAGMLSSVFSNLLTTPGERIKCLLQIQQAASNATTNNALYKGPIDCAIKLYKDGGFRSLYRGMFATLWRDVPAGGAYFVTYETIKREPLQYSNSQNYTTNNLNPSRTLLAGGMAGIVFWIFALPPDVIKSRLQTASADQYPNGMRDVFREILQKEGIAGFYQGYMAVFLRAFPANAACFLGYELTMKLLNWLWKQ